MVVGGYNSKDKLLNDVELISSTPNNVCSKHVKPIFGDVSKYIGVHLELTQSFLFIFIGV